MNRLRIIICMFLTLVLIGAWECGGTPQSQCQSGSQKWEHKNGKTTHYVCHNNEWVKEP